MSEEASDYTMGTQNLLSKKKLSESRHGHSSAAKLSGCLSKNSMNVEQKNGPRKNSQLVNEQSGDKSVVPAPLENSSNSAMGSIKNNMVRHKLSSEVPYFNQHSPISISNRNMLPVKQAKSNTKDHQASSIQKGHESIESDIVDRELKRYKEEDKGSVSEVMEEELLKADD